MSKKKAKELNSNPMTAPAYKKSDKKDEVPLWKVWKWSLRNPGVNPWRNEKS